MFMTQWVWKNPNIKNWIIIPFDTKNMYYAICNLKEVLDRKEKQRIETQKQS